MLQLVETLGYAGLALLSLVENLIPPIPGTWSPMAMYESYQKLRVVRDGEGASLFYAHDPEVFKATKQAPAFYE